jgi:surface protein
MFHFVRLKLLSLILAIFSVPVFAQTMQADSSKQASVNTLEQSFFLSSNGRTIICSSAEFNESGEVNGVTYTKRSKQDITVKNTSTTCTSGVFDLSYVFYSQSSFNEDITHWDVSSVYDLSYMLYDAKSFDQDLSNWCVSNLATTPVNFSEGSGLRDEFQPKWGTCPLTAQIINDK